MAAAEREYPAAERKLAGVADCGYWYRNGGVVAQNLEAAKCTPLCAMCHVLDPSSNAANCNRADPAKRTQAAHTTDRHFAKQVRWAGYRKTNRDYVNALKRRVGRCERADCPGDGPSQGACTAGFEQCYDWDHQDPATKTACISQIISKKNAFETVKPRVLRELGLPENFDVGADAVPPKHERHCQLLCRNCHRTRRFWDTDYDGYA